MVATKGIDGRWSEHWPFFYVLEDALSVWMNLGKQLLFVWLFVSRIKTGTRRIIRLNELSSVVHLERRTTENSLSRRIMRLVPVFRHSNSKSLFDFRNVAPNLRKQQEMPKYGKQEFVMLIEFFESLFTRDLG